MQKGKKRLQGGLERALRFLARELGEPERAPEFLAREAGYSRLHLRPLRPRLRGGNNRSMPTALKTDYCLSEASCNPFSRRHQSGPP
ncbi:MAG: hypothetical protein LBH61_02645, partial [Dysgonamonadaceae bacterium]|nr:hypothetical protein [Dysgonamonadaceae bacterium]